MKHKIILFGVSLFTLLACEEGDKVFDEITNDVKRGAILRTVSLGANTASYDVVSGTIQEGGFEATVELQDPENGNLLQALEVYVGYNDNTGTKGPSTIGSNEVLAKSFALSEGVIGEFGYPRFTYSATAQELQTALGIPNGDIFGGDQFTVRFQIVQVDGSTYSVADNSGTLTGSFFSSPFEYTLTLTCGPKPTQPGTWTVEMQDAYGDGWQPTTSNGGGPGLVITLSDGTVFEIGLCTPYEDPGYNCTPGTSAGTATFVVPDGQTAAADIQFNGDFWGEISFQIFTPSGNKVADVGTSTDAGSVAIDFCAD